MYIRLCAKHARVHRFNANSAPNEQEGGCSAGVALDSAALGPRPLLRAAGSGPALLAPSFPPALRPVLATAWSWPPRRWVGDCQGWGWGAFCRLPHPRPEAKRSAGCWRGGHSPAEAPCSLWSVPLPCACSAADVSTPSLYSLSLECTNFFWWFFFFYYYSYFGEKVTLGNACAMPRFIFPLHVPDSSSTASPKTSRVPVTLCAEATPVLGPPGLSHKSTADNQTRQNCWL